jgi:hypothetical protein
MITIVTGPKPTRIPGPYTIQIQREGIYAQIDVTVTDDERMSFHQRAGIVPYALSPEVLRELADFLEGK